MAGNSNSGRRKNAYITDALTIEMKAREMEANGDKRGVRKMAEKVWDLAEGGERWAVEFIRDTVDGKPAQAIDISGALDTASNRMTDEELESIASASGAGITETPPSPSKLN